MTYTPETPLEILLVVAGMYVTVQLVWSLLSGWFTLSASYRHEGEFPKNRKSFQSLSMGYSPIIPVSYSNIVQVGVVSGSVYLSIFIIFRLFHPPLKIPFSQLSGTERCFLWLRYVELKTKAAGRQRIWVSKKLAEWLEAGSEGAWTFFRH